MPDQEKLPEASSFRVDPAFEIAPPELFDLMRRMLITKEVRFNSSLRLQREKTYAELVISALSFVIAGFSIVALVFANDLSPKQISVVGTLGVIISIYIIILNYEFGKRNFDSSIVQLDISSYEIHELYIKLRYDIFQIKTKRDTIRKYKYYFDNYNAILKKFHSIHQEKDYEYVMLRNPHLIDITRTQLDARRIRRAYQRSHVYLALKALAFPTTMVLLGIFLLIYFGGRQDPSAEGKVTSTYSLVVFQTNG